MTTYQHTPPTPQRQAIEYDDATAARELLQPEPVRLHHYPRWLQRRIRARLQIKVGICREDQLRRAVAITGSDDWLDHWGTSRLGTRRSFVSEPYASTQQIVSAKAFGDALGLELYIDPNSYWYPGRTLRLEFVEPDREVSR